MGLIKCSECKNKVSEKADTCPKCGAPVVIPPKKKGISGLTSIIVIGLAIWVASGIIGDQKQQMDAEEKASRQKALNAKKIKQEESKKLVVFFTENRGKIIASLKKDLSDKAYKKVISESEKYIITADEEIKTINSTAKIEQKKIDKVLKTKANLAELKKVPTSNFYIKNL